MEELSQLREFIKDGRYHEALALVGELEEMSRDDKINKIESFIDILLIHLIKQEAEKRSTRLEEASIFNAVRQINIISQRRKSVGYYLTEEEIRESIEESYPIALKYASLEAFGGVLDELQLGEKIDEKQIKNQAVD